MIIDISTIWYFDHELRRTVTLLLLLYTHRTVVRRAYRYVYLSSIDDVKLYNNRRRVKWQKKTVKHVGRNINIINCMDICILQNKNNRNYLRRLNIVHVIYYCNTIINIFFSFDVDKSQFIIYYFYAELLLYILRRYNHISSVVCSQCL